MNDQNIIFNLEAIIALDTQNGFSKNGNIPWTSKKDMNYFKSKTVNKTVIMGYNTLLSLPKSAPLKNRHNIIVTNNKHKYMNDYSQYDNIEFLNYEETINHINKYNMNNIIVIGGVEILNLFLHHINKIYITKFKQSFECDKFYILNETKYDKHIIYDDDELTIFELKSIFL